MRCLIAVLLFLFFFSCSSPSGGNTHDMDQKEKIINEISKRASDQLVEKYGLIPFGSGGRAMDQVKMLMLAFTYNKTINQNQARELLLGALESFADAINADVRIHPYLANFPFEPINIKIEIYLRDSTGRPLNEGPLVLVSASSGYLEYEARDPETHRLVTVHKETYEEAKQLLQKAQPSDAI